MRHTTILYSLSLILLFSFGCKEDVPQSSNKEVVNNDTVLNPFVKYRVMIEDTNTFTNYIRKRDSLWFAFRKTKDSTCLKLANSLPIPCPEFEAYKSTLINLINNGKVFVTDKDLKITDSRILRRDIYIMCDSIMFTDDPSKPHVFVCDSSSRILEVSGLDFYEKWMYNKETGSITKEILAYSPMRFDEERQKLLPAFFVFKNKEIYNEIKSKIQNNKN